MYRLLAYILLFIVLPGNLLVAQEKILISPFDKLIRWGESLTTADFNSDGQRDLAVLAPDYKNARLESTGIVTLYYGNQKGFSGHPDLMLEPGLPGCSDGVMSCTSGDFNNDGFDDLVISNPLYGEPQLDRGFVQIFFGSKKGLFPSNSLLETGESAYGSFGSQVKCMDYNKDGTIDLLVESRFADLLEGRMYIYFGGKDFTMDQPDVTLGVENTQALHFEFFTDFNNDGKDDLVCRTNNYWNAGKAQFYIFEGGRNTGTEPLVQFEIEQFTARLYLKKHRILIGTNSSVNGTKCLAMRLNDGSISKIPWETEGMPFSLTDHRFLVVSLTNKPVLRSFEVMGAVITEKSRINLPFNLKANLQLFRERILCDDREWLVIPVVINGRESLFFEKFPEILF